MMVSAISSKNAICYGVSGNEGDFFSVGLQPSKNAAPPITEPPIMVETRVNNSRLFMFFNFSRLT